tara:strand:- start:1090 stop:1692 length:603 start_codon:yes stop_codon:yes gene_type:complete
MIQRMTKDQMDILVFNMQEDNNPNARFANSAHSLWTRFHNYTERNAPYACIVDGEVTAVVMMTLLTREPYANLYEIFAVKPTYAGALYWSVMRLAKEMGAERLKMSCTPSSIGWHMKNGIVGWAVDPSGSIRVDIPICDSQEEQLALREDALTNPSLVLPPEKFAQKLASEENSFGPIKIIKVEKSIETMGDYYMRKEIL